MRKLGGTITLLPFTYAAMLIASLSLMAIPYLSGNSSKDLILELAATHISIPGNFMWILGSIIAGITACYSIRLIALTFIGEANAAKPSYTHIHEQSLGLIIPMVTLSILSIYFGYVAKEPLAGMGSDSVINYYTYRSNALYMPSNNAVNLFTLNSVTEAEFGLDFLVKNLPVICTIIGTLTGILLFIFTPSALLSLVHPSTAHFNTHKTIEWRDIRNTNYQMYNALSSKWFIDSLYARIISWPVYELGFLCSNAVDRVVLEMLGAQGLSLIAFKLDHTLTGPNIETTLNKLPGTSTVRGIVQKADIYDNLPTFTNNVPEYALYVGIIAIVLTLCIIGNIFAMSMLLILLYALFITLV